MSHRVPGSVFYPPLRSLVELGLARRMPPRSDRRVFYTITGARAWAPLRHVVDMLQVEDSDEGAVA
ncbi:hypothetical protein [Micromonospora coerulea]|uniref:hypothetical protein n=1 Tax=Micromonospora coerulea TaxID=47856 RepID=UPI001F189039|nr:hypothetical protein [Micromonospora veneta]